MAVSDQAEHHELFEFFVVVFGVAGSALSVVGGGETLVVAVERVLELVDKP